MNTVVLSEDNSQMGHRSHRFSRFMSSLRFFVKFLPLLLLLIGMTSGPPPFNEIPPLKHVEDVREKKRSFLAFMKPKIQAENDRLRELRKKLTLLYREFQETGRIPPQKRSWFEAICRSYDIEPGEDETLEEPWIRLFRRVDVVPLELALAQSASESAWGTSRFARLGNSFFGQWTYQKDAGMKPFGIPEDGAHRVARYSTVRESVRSYMKNLNTHWAYRSFRNLRFEQRLQGKKPDALHLVKGLEMYSEQRHAYIRQIQTIIETNREIIESL